MSGPNMFEGAVCPISSHLRAYFTYKVFVSVSFWIYILWSAAVGVFLLILPLTYWVWAVPGWTMIAVHLFSVLDKAIFEWCKKI